MKKIVLTIVAFLSFAFFNVVQAQAQEVESFAPQKNDFTVSVNFGVGSHIGWSAPQPNLPEYTLSAPTEAWFDKKPILSLEGRWFISNKWALKLTGAFAYSYNPAYNEVTGTAVDSDKFGPGDLPQYNAVPSSDNIQFSVGVGAEHYWALDDRLFLRAGGELGFAYGRVTVNAPDSEAYMGAAIGEAYAFRVAPVCGVDYFFARRLFAGLEVRPLAYQYSVYGERPQVGMSLLSSDSHSFSFIVQPMIKLGVRF